MQISSASKSKIFFQFLVFAFFLQLIVLLAYWRNYKKLPILGYLKDEKSTNAEIGEVTAIDIFFEENSTEEFVVLENDTAQASLNLPGSPIIRKSKKRVKSAPKNPKSVFKFVDASHDYMNVCVLPEYDYLDPTIEKYHDPSFNPKSGCDEANRPWTQLVNGTWSVVEQWKGANCKARCHYDAGDDATRVGEWMEPGPVDCEILEAACWETWRTSAVHGYIHTQIIPKKPKLPRRFKDQPNVFVIMQDSMSTGAAKRLMPKTLKYLQEKFESVEFPFVNRVGLNSRPNGYPLWFGRQATNVHNKKYGGVDVDLEMDLDEICPKFLDGRRHIFDDFEQYGYVTMDEEDWAQSMVNYPGCLGFAKPATSHHFHPFTIVNEWTGLDATKEYHSNSENCEELHHRLYTYLQQFIDAYKDKGAPLFAWTWVVDVSHDYFNGLARYDQVLLDFLQNNEELYDNSFLIFMSDHGIRQASYLGLADTELHAFEQNNPYTTISVPKKYRKTGIVERMRENAKQLQTHFDTRATLLDILWLQPQENFADTSFLEFPGEKGHSYFRQQPDFPRTCGRLPIPNGYCLCRIEKEVVQNETLKEEYGRLLIAFVNAELERGKYSGECVEHGFNLTTSMYRLSEDNFEISVQGTAPSNAIFQSFVYNDRETVEFTTVTRVDTYGDTGSCMKSTYFEKLCYCKVQPKKKKTKD